MGVMYGDPYNMPSYIGWLSALVFLLIGFIQAYIMLSFLFPLYYMYGSIEAHEQEKNKFNGCIPQPRLHPRETRL